MNIATNYKSNAAIPKKTFTIKKLTVNEKLAIFRQQHLSLLKKVEQTGEIPHAKFKQDIHPVMLGIVKAKRVCQGHKLNIIADEIKNEGRPIIFNLTHICKDDAERALEAIDGHCYILAGDQELTTGIDLIFMESNGVLWLDTSLPKNLSEEEMEAVKTDRKVNKALMGHCLAQGIDIFMSMEGIWNLSRKSLPVLDIHPGAIDIAYENDADIATLAIERAGNIFHIYKGKNHRIRDLIEAENCEYSEARERVRIKIRDDMTRCKWPLIELASGLKNGAQLEENLQAYFEEYFKVCLKRSEFDPETYFREWRKRVLAEYPPFTDEIIDEREYKTRLLRNFESETAAIEKDLTGVIQSAVFTSEDEFKSVINGTKRNTDKNSDRFTEPEEVEKYKQEQKRKRLKIVA